MGRKVKYSSKEKINAAKKYLDKKDSMNSIAKRLDITFQTFKQWVNNYEAMGADAFMTCHNKHYSKAEKEQAVAAYLAGEGSHMDICKKYKIHSTTQLRRWIKKYNGHEELKASGTGGLAIMTKGRKTSFEERIEIVEYCIAHNHNYTATAEKYKISYQQARNYTVKYEDDGVDALQDRRGKRKSENMMSELERLRAEVEASFSKKLNEIDRRRG